jgi:Flp pilus assembly protein TadG
MMTMRTGHPRKTSEEDVLKGDSGVVALEFALTAPLIILVVLGAMAFAIHFAIVVALIHAASEGARASISGLSDADRQTAAQTRVQQVFSTYGGILSANKAGVSTQAGSVAGTYQVTVTYTPGAADVMNTFNGFCTFVNKQCSAASGVVSYTATVANGGYSS